ncbi:MAG: DUF721 domain-containing protein [Elusimicrobia bacterium]|nr:DUF721 domain-containing protein [Elusimicrobiota bacterium]
MARNFWSSGATLAKSWRVRNTLQPDRMAILNAVWEKELGALAHYWTLDGVRAGYLYVQPRSSAAIQELQLREAGITRGLNKYFKTPWIKGIKIKKF